MKQVKTGLHSRLFDHFRSPFSLLFKKKSPFPIQIIKHYLQNVITLSYSGLKCQKQTDPTQFSSCFSLKYVFIIGCSWVFAIWESWPNIKKSKVSISLKKRLPNVYLWKMDLLKFPKGHFSLPPMYIIGNSVKRIKGPATAHVGPTSLLSMTMIHKKLID